MQQNYTNTEGRRYELFNSNTAAVFLEKALVFKMRLHIWNSSNFTVFISAYISKDVQYWEIYM